MTASFVFPRVQALPGIDRASMRIDGVERVGYEFGQSKPRPFLFPVVGPSGPQLTRMGHPNPVGHEHHRSVWFGHQKINSINFWEERAQSDIQIRHKRVVVYQDGPDWAALMAELDWWAVGQRRMRQTLVIALEPQSGGGYALDLQSRFEAAGAPVELGQTNFGFLGVRVAKTLSEQFGDGRLTSSEGGQGAAALFGKQARWVDYSGPSAPGVVEGIAYFDHPSNPAHPTAWHVRADGWMEAAFNLANPYGIPPDHPLDLRYRLLIHAGPADPTMIDQAWSRFATTAPYVQTPARAGQPPSLQRA
jgi:hypothetical protein